MASAPFAPGSVSIRLYPHNELPADAIVSELCRASRSRPRQRLRRGHDQRAPRWLCRLHGATAADGLLRLGRARHRLGRRCATRASTAVHGARRRGGRVAPGSTWRSCRTWSGRRGSASGLRGGRRQSGRCNRPVQVGAPTARRDAPGRGSGRARGRPGAAGLPADPGTGAQPRPCPLPPPSAQLGAGPGS